MTGPAIDLPFQLDALQLIGRHVAFDAHRFDVAGLARGHRLERQMDVAQRQRGGRILQRIENLDRPVFNRHLRTNVLVLGQRQQLGRAPRAVGPPGHPQHRPAQQNVREGRIAADQFLHRRVATEEDLVEIGQLGLRSFGAPLADRQAPDLDPLALRSVGRTGRERSGWDSAPQVCSRCARGSPRPCGDTSRGPPPPRRPRPARAPT